MRAYVRTGRSTGVSFGPLGALVMVIGAVFYAVAVVLVFLVGALITLGAFVVAYMRERRVQRDQTGD